MLCLTAGYVRGTKDTKMSSPFRALTCFGPQRACGRDAQRMRDLRSFWPKEAAWLGTYSWPVSRWRPPAGLVCHEVAVM